MFWFVLNLLFSFCLGYLQGWWVADCWLVCLWLLFCIWCFWWCSLFVEICCLCWFWLLACLRFFGLVAFVCVGILVVDYVLGCWFGYRFAIADCLLVGYVVAFCLVAVWFLFCLFDLVIVLKLWADFDLRLICLYTLCFGLLLLFYYCVFDLRCVGWFWTCLLLVVICLRDWMCWFNCVVEAGCCDVFTIVWY